MPSTVLTTSSMRCETSVSISSGDAPVKVVRTVTVGRSTAGKAIHAELEITRRTDHHQRQHDHRGKDRAANTDFGELLH